jgi:signal transduction histidine kinase
MWACHPTSLPLVPTRKLNAAGSRHPAARVTRTFKAPATDALSPAPILAAGADPAADIGPDPADRARLAHELRAPLAAIHSLADVIALERFGPVGNEIYRDYAESIREAARHLIAAVESALAPPADPGRPSPPASDLAFDLNGAATLVGRLLVEIAARRASHLELRLAPSLPLLLADRTAVTRIISNLAINALRHSPLQSRVVLRTGQGAGGTVWIEVEDDGPGLPQEIAAAILDDAECANSPCGNGAGSAGTSGLGLPMVKRLAEANGAGLTFSRSSTGGTCARVSFPPGRQLPGH